MSNIYFTITILVGIEIYVLLSIIRKQEQEEHKKNEQIFDNNIHPYPMRMSNRGIIWGSIICIPFWLMVVVLIKEGVIALKTFIFMGLALPAMLLFLILASSLRNKRDKQDRDIIVEDISTPTPQSKTYTQDLSETGTPR